MAEIVEVKLRPVGNALGVILPGRMIKEEKLKSGETIFVSVLRKRKASVKELRGLTKGASSFERDHAGRN